MAKRAGALRPHQKLIAYENGETFDLWTTRVDSGGVWDVPLIANFQGQAINWYNDNGAARGIAAYRLDGSNFTLETTGSETDEHTVHYRMPHSNANTDHGVGPATAQRTGTGIGDCYAVLIQNTGSPPTPQINIVKIVAGAPSTLATAANTTVQLGDVVSLSFQHNPTAFPDPTSRLTAYVNGVQVAQAVDATSAIDFTGTSTFGLYGENAPATPAGESGNAEITYEWWVTNGNATFSEPPSRSHLSTGLRLVIMQREYWADSARPVMHRMVAGPLTSVTWSFSRIGGPKTLKAKFRYADVSGAEHVDRKFFIDPNRADWDGRQWGGGEVILEYHHTGSILDDSPPSTFLGTDIVWRGRISRIKADPATEEIDLEAEGLLAAMEEVFVTGTYDAIAIREIIEDVLQQVAKGNAPANNFGGGGPYIKFNAAKIIAPGSVLDTRISIEFDNSSLRSAIKSLFEYMPAGAVWGVDTASEFYVDQQVDTFSVDWTGAGIQSFRVDSDAVKFSRDLDFSRIRNSQIVFGDERDISSGETGKGTTERFGGRADSTRSRHHLGLRQERDTNGDVGTDGEAAKLAIALLRGKLLPAMNAKIEVTTPIIQNKELWQSLIVAAPSVAVTDRQTTIALAGGSSSDGTATEYGMRLYGDWAAFSCNDRGTQGAVVSIASSTAEQNLDTSWLVHVSIRFDWAHPEGSSSTERAFLFGRDRVGVGSFGWGSLWWEGTSGNLEWRYETDLGVGQTLSTGISVDPVTPAGTIVRFTVWRDSGGVFRFYDGTTLEATNSARTADVIETNTDAWRWFDMTYTAATVHPSDFAWDEFWVYDTTLLEAGISVATFIAQTNNLMLPRNLGGGLLLYIRGQLPASGTSVDLPGVRDASLLTPPSLSAVEATWTLSQGTGTGNGVVVTTAAVRGSELGHEKKWGGPLIFNAETVSYEVDVAAALLTRKLTLGSIPQNLMSTLATLQDEISKVKELRTKTT